jgi:hypothetical protein
MQWSAVASICLPFPGHRTPLFILTAASFPLHMILVREATLFGPTLHTIKEGLRSSLAIKASIRYSDWSEEGKDLTQCPFTI